MGIRFDPQTAAAVMKAYPGQAQNVLYKVFTILKCPIIFVFHAHTSSKVKMMLDKLVAISVRAGGAAVSTREFLPGGVLPLPNMPLRMSKPQYDTASQLMFEAAMRQLVENPTEVILKRHLRPFEEAGARHERRVERERAAGEAAANQADAAVRNRRLYDQQQNRAFMDAYEQRGLEVWLENQQRASTRLEVKRRVAVKEAEGRGARAEAAWQYSHGQVTGGIRDFEARLGLMAATASNGRESKPAAEEPDAPEAPEAELRADAEHVLAVRARRHEAERLSSARERRRRKFITEREEAQVVTTRSLELFMVFLVFRLTSVRPCR